MKKTTRNLQTVAVVTIVTTMLGGTMTTFAAENQDKAAYQSRASVKFIPNTDPTHPVDPENPGTVDPIDPINPEGPNEGTNGPLSIDFASSLNFGMQKITSTDEIYYAYSQKVINEKKETINKPNYVQVTDNRGSGDGWQLTVKQSREFETKEDVKNKVLKGAAITLDGTIAYSEASGTGKPEVEKSILLEPDVSQKVMTAAKNAGEGTWVARFGTSDSDLFEDSKALIETDGEIVQGKINKNKKVSLLVPGKIAKSQASYATELVWTLSEVNDNSSER